ncbi:MAG: AGE family epimerase/isomerase [Rhizobiaceae bacterium]|nr:AGE family epimerase/isomerase [Rhizobiaceae bacterium]
MSDRIVSFVMSGGVGSRLWPLSREDNPKQFHALAGDRSMLAKTLARLKARPAGDSPVFVIGAERHAARVLNDLAPVDLAGGGAIFEPVGRNTAAAVAVATLHTLDAFGDDLVLIVPSDHEISTDAQFWQSVEAGTGAARNGHIVVFGIAPDAPETGYGYIEVGPSSDGVADVTRFVEKPDLATARTYLAAGNFYWNAGIFLFRAGAMRDAFLKHQPAIWTAAAVALGKASREVSGVYLPLDEYQQIPSISIDYAIMEKASGIDMVPATFRWNDLGSWQSLLEVGNADTAGNVILGDVVAIDCENSYIRSEGRLVSAVGLRGMAVVATADATFVAPVSHSQNVKKVVEQLEKSGRLETRFTPASDRVQVSGAWRRRVSHWLFDETLPRWSTRGVDRLHGGFHEALAFDGTPLMKPKRMRTMGRQIYAFAVARQRGWDGPADELIAHGIDFIASRGRTRDGGWARTLGPEGDVIDPVEDAYDHACVLLALAHAHRCGNADALGLAGETFGFLDRHLEDGRMTGFLESPGDAGIRRSNPHMHMLEAFLAWFNVTGDRAYLRRAARIVDLFRSAFFDADNWTLGEYFDGDWKPAPDGKGDWTEPGHHFEWASLLVDFAAKSGQKDLIAFARKLYASAVANGVNRATGLAYGAVSRQGIPLDRMSRSWPQSEAVKAAIALDGTGGPDLKPEIEARVGRLFRWHIDPAPTGLWIDRIDEGGRAVATEVPASIFYHLVCALTQYLDATEGAEARS